MLTLAAAKKLAKMFPYYLKPVGSIARQEPYVGDIDFLSLKPIEQVVDDMEKIGNWIRIKAMGSHHMSAWIHLGKFKIKVDVWKTTRESLLFAKFHYIGNKQFNIRSRAQAKRLGYRLNQYGLYDRRGRRVPVPNERALFRLLDMTYVPPKQRR